MTLVLLCFCAIGNATAGVTPSEMRCCALDGNGAFGTVRPRWLLYRENLACSTPLVGTRAAAPSCGGMAQDAGGRPYSTRPDLCVLARLRQAIQSIDSRVKLAMISSRDRGIAVQTQSQGALRQNVTRVPGWVSPRAHVMCNLHGAQTAQNLKGCRTAR
ncbi:uncharacterized protein PG986_001989 [Apiospora aurea]|uniref:Secreted protein n=1 Tax=Apiospora aurea TaxID=335848 RepID=A0ABR1QZ34_9PEZI